MSKTQRSRLKETVAALSTVVLVSGAAGLPAAVAAPAGDLPVQLAAGCNPCNPCAAKSPCNPCNPCAAASPCNPCNPCAAKVVNPCNPCAAKSPCNPCNPCAAKNPCNPCAAN